MWHRTACKISVSLSFLKCNDFYRISELMLPLLVQRNDENHFIFDPVQKRESNSNFTGCQMPHFMIILIQLIKPFLDKKYGPFNTHHVKQ